MAKVQRAKKPRSYLDVRDRHPRSRCTTTSGGSVASVAAKASTNQNWTCGSRGAAAIPTRDALSDVYRGNGWNARTGRGQRENPVHEPATLAPATTYSWQIVARTRGRNTGAVVVIRDACRVELLWRWRPGSAFMWSGDSRHRRHGTTRPSPSGKHATAVLAQALWRSVGFVPGHERRRTGLVSSLFGARCLR